MTLHDVCLPLSIGENSQHSLPRGEAKSCFQLEGLALALSAENGKAGRLSAAWSFGALHPTPLRCCQLMGGGGFTLLGLLDRRQVTVMKLSVL